MGRSLCRTASWIVGMVAELSDRRRTESSQILCPMSECQSFVYVNMTDQWAQSLKMLCCGCGCGGCDGECQCAHRRTRRGQAPSPRPSKNRHDTPSAHSDLPSSEEIQICSNFPPVALFMFIKQRVAVIPGRSPTRSFCLDICQ